MFKRSNKGYESKKVENVHACKYIKRTKQLEVNKMVGVIPRNTVRGIFLPNSSIVAQASPSIVNWTNYQKSIFKRDNLDT